jgi:hypothetical protein
MENLILLIEQIEASCSEDQKSEFEVLKATAKELQIKFKRLEEFKAYVHEKLDDMGIPENPEPEKTEQHGCRISERLKFIENKSTEFKKLLDEFNQALVDYSGTMQQKWIQIMDKS